jgi:hypothetical protein
MKRQFELLEELYKKSEEANVRIAAVRREIEREYAKIRKEIIEAYDHEKEVMLLVQFGDYSLDFHMATKEKLSTIKLTWFESNIKIRKPKTYEEAVELLRNYHDPSNCELSSYQTFGYFDDIEKRWDRVDWITENLMEKNFLFDIEEADFTKALNTLYKHYENNLK